MIESPFTITVYNKEFEKRGTIGNPLSVTVTPRHNQQSNAELTVSATHPRVVDLIAPGARVWIRYHGDHLLSGVVVSYKAAGPLDTASFTFQITDDWFLFSRLLAWPTPGAALDAQVDETDTRSGPAESVLKAIVSANMSRSTPAITVGTDLARGSAITVTNRFKPLTDRLMPVIDDAGIGTLVVQAGAGLLVDVYTVNTYPRDLTEESGVIIEWSVSHAGPTATQVVVGGKGEGTARVFTSVQDGTLEGLYGYSVEVFKDDTDSDTDSDRVITGVQTLADNAPTAGLSIKLSETSSFRYDPTGIKGVRVGDIVTMRVGPGLVVTDVIRQVTLSWSVTNGFNVTPQVGDRSNEPDKLLVNVIASLARGLRNLTGR